MQMSAQVIMLRILPSLTFTRQNNGEVKSIVLIFS